MTANIMAGNRWINLDFDQPRLRESADPESAGVPPASTCGQDARAPRRSTEAPASAPSDSLPPVVLQAQGAYLLRNYQAAIDLLERPLQVVPVLEGGQRVLGQSLARLNREPAAIERLREAVRHSATDWLARASLASLVLRSPIPPSEAGAPGEVSAESLLEAAVPLAPARAQGQIRELLGAARWCAGQEALRDGRAREAERRFSLAGAEFARAAAGSPAARRELPQRRAASLVGQAVALLLAGEPEAAQRLYSRTPLPPVAPTDPLSRFAAGLYELCEEMTRLSSEDQAPAAEALREVVLETRLAVGFYDGRSAVSLSWWNGTS
jgi:hypothetical protein